MSTSHAPQFTSPVLYLAMELSSSNWKLGFSAGGTRKPRRRDVPAGDVRLLKQEIRRAKQKLDLAEDAPVVSCYEAGRDGFWIHRDLGSQGIHNVVIDPASVDVDRRARRAKTDRLDVEKLLAVLTRWARGEDDVWSVVNPPTPAQEDARHLHRELETLKREQTGHINRIKGLLNTIGIRVTQIDRSFPRWLERAHRVDVQLKGRLQREFERMQLVNQQIRHLEKERVELLRRQEKSQDPSHPLLAMILQLMELSAVSVNSSWLFVHEVFGWREIKNRRELAALIGLTPMPYNSGSSHRDQGISKAGNRRMRTMAIEIAWCWLRYQPDSQLSRWYQRRFGSGSKRQRRIGIVALARKLMIALWKYLKGGELPEGATLKASITYRYTPSLC